MLNFKRSDTARSPARPTFNTEHSTFNIPPLAIIKDDVRSRTDRPTRPPGPPSLDTARSDDHRWAGAARGLALLPHQHQPRFAGDAREEVSDALGGRHRHRYPE